MILYASSFAKVQLLPDLAVLAMLAMVEKKIVGAAGVEKGLNVERNVEQRRISSSSIALHKQVCCLENSSVCWVEPKRHDFANLGLQISNLQ